MIWNEEIGKIKTWLKRLLGVNNIDTKALLRIINELDKLKSDIKDDKKKPIIFVVSPWLMTAIPYQFILFAFICRYWGYNASIVWNDKISYFEGDTSVEQYNISNFFKKLKDTSINIYKYSDFYEEKGKSEITISKEKLFDEAKAMAIHHLRTSFTLNENIPLIDRYYQGLIEELPYVTAIAHRFKGSKIVVPGGVCGNTSLYYHFIKTPYMLKVSSIDSFIAGNQRPAVHKDSFIEYKEYISTLDEEEKRKIILAADYEIEQRISGREKLWDGTSYQSAISMKTPSYDILITPNIEWDSAALNQNDVFSTMYEWVSETLEWLLVNTDYSVAIRQHPAERKAFVNNIYPNYIRQFIHDKYGDENRICFYSADDNVNTYDLIKSSKIILPWSSDVAIDAAVLGKRSILHTDAYYQEQQYVTRVYSKKDYYGAIVEAVNKEGEEYSMDDAKIDYFFHSHFFVPSEATDATPSVFNSFVKNKTKDIIDNPVLVDLLHSWLNDESFMLLNYKRQLKDKA
jgi:hypothetical protein